MLGQRKRSSYYDSSSSPALLKHQNEDLRSLMQFNLIEDVAKNLTINQDNFINKDDPDLTEQCLSLIGSNSQMNSSVKNYGVPEDDNNSHSQQTDNPQIFSWGRNTNGELGIDKNDNFIVDPLPICLRDTAFIVKKVACGKSHCLFVDKSGFLFSMGSNEYGQLGINDTIIRQKSRPSFITLVSDPKQIVCGTYSSFALANDGNLFSWGRNDQSQLGYQSVNVFVPRKVPFHKSISQISAGESHGALISNNQAYTWGSNQQGQLGHQLSGIGDLQLKSERVSCGQNYTILLTEAGELMIAGQLPFKVNSQYSLKEFQQLAKFEKNVQIKQIESSRFTSILAQLPGEEKTELFLWGETPLGNFQEPMSLNQIINETQPDEQQTQLDIFAVKNGAHFCVFIEKQTGLTFQLGSEFMSNPYEDLKVQVALTELRDMTFLYADSFACGDSFVIGQGKILNEAPRSPIKRSSSPIRRCSILPSSAIYQSDLSEIESLGPHEDQSSLPQPIQKEASKEVSKESSILVNEDEVTPQANQQQENSMQDLNQSESSSLPSGLPTAEECTEKSQNQHDLSKHSQRPFAQDIKRDFSACVSPIKHVCHNGQTHQNLASSSISSQPINNVPKHSHVGSNNFSQHALDIYLRHHLDDSSLHLKHVVKNENNNSQFEKNEVEVLKEQLEKSRRDYQRILSQLNEDQDEVIELRNKIRNLQSENTHLTQKYIDIQLQLQDDIRRKKPQPCQCSVQILALQEQLEYKTKEVSTLTVTVQSLNSENSDMSKQLAETLTDLNLQQMQKLEMSKSMNKITDLEQVNQILLRQLEEQQIQLTYKQRESEELREQFNQSQLDLQSRMTNLEIMNSKQAQLQIKIDCLTDEKQKLADQIRNLQEGFLEQNKIQLETFQKQDSMKMDENKLQDKFNTIMGSTIVNATPQFKKVEAACLSMPRQRVTNGDIVDFLNQELKQHLPQIFQNEAIHEQQKLLKHENGCMQSQNLNRQNRNKTQSKSPTALSDQKFSLQVDNGPRNITINTSREILKKSSMLRVPTPIRNSTALDAALQKMDQSKSPPHGSTVATPYTNVLSKSRSSMLLKEQKTATQQNGRTQTPVLTKLHKFEASTTPRTLRTPKVIKPVQMNVHKDTRNRVKHQQLSILPILKENSVEEQPRSIPQSHHHKKPSYPEELLQSDQQKCYDQYQSYPEDFQNENLMSSKLKQIKTNKELLEKRILEYEKKLQTINLFNENSSDFLSDNGKNLESKPTTVKTKTLSTALISCSRGVLKDQRKRSNV